MVDTMTPKFLDRNGRSALKGANRVTIYDHHLCSLDDYRAFIKNGAEVNIHDSGDEYISSCCEVIWHMLNEEEIKRISKQTLTALLAGIHDETHSFSDINNRTNQIVGQLICLGADAKVIGYSCAKEFGMWGKLKYFGKSIQQLLWLKEAKIAIIKTNFTDYSAANHTILKETGKNRSPLYILGALRKYKIRYCRTLEAYALVYDREISDDQLRFALILDLVK